MTTVESLRSPAPDRGQNICFRQGRAVDRSTTRKRRSLTVGALLGLASTLACSGGGSEDSPVADPHAGLRPNDLARWAETVAGKDTAALLILRNDRLVYEWYADGRSSTRRHYTASLAKGLFGGLGLALALDSGLIQLDDPIENYMTAWKADPKRRELTIRQLASHTSGLADAAARGPERQPWEEDFWKRDPKRTPIHLAISETPLSAPAGQRVSYSNPGFAVLSYGIARALQHAGRPDLRDFLQQRLFRPLGIADEEWSMGYGEPFEVDGLRVWATWGGGSISPRALLAVGRLLLRRGRSGDRQILDPQAIEAVTIPVSMAAPADPPNSIPVPAAGWWSNARGVWNNLPRGAFAAVGAGHQLLLVVPSLDLVVVRLGESLPGTAPGGSLASLMEALSHEVMDPLGDLFSPIPVPWSEQYGGAWFDPPEAVECRAHGSDNWPLTWTADDTLFAAYGDGWGFEPRVDRKLSLGFAQLDGGPDAFTARNVRSSTGEREGDGRHGAKASGLISVDGTLYMWVRNLGNSQIAWSTDQGRSWQWGFRWTESFGSPSFLNFGRDYAGARDDYVYTFSQDGPSAYSSDDRVILARVPKRRLLDQSSYEFFAGIDETGRPRWSAVLAERRGVLEFAQGCRRIEVIHNPGLGRYLMALGFDHQGGWGLFEASEPWGPWRSVYHTPRWDYAKTHSYRLPTRWIENGGRTLRLVFSGRDGSGVIADAFCIRRLRLLPAFDSPSV